MVEYGYDVASRLTSITYKQNGTIVLGDLTYEYNKNGNRIKTGGSFARTGIPDVVGTTAYNAANQQTTIADKTLTYDNNGNLQTITDPSGTTTYTWNARNQLVGISGPGVSASFVYDGLGRREQKTVNGGLTEFLFDGVDPVQETSGATILANMLSGAGVDEIITRADATTGATSTLLTDALGSPVALADNNGVVQTEYTYEPFGKTNLTGSSNSNSYQYTGRENDGTGLYYYRSRYYHPVLQRFISEDPIEFAAGDPNLYAYVGNNPTNYLDPNGENPLAAIGGACIGGALAGVGGEFGAGWISGRKPTPSEVGSAALAGCAIGAAGAALDGLIGGALSWASRGVWTPHGLATQGYSAAASAAATEARAGALGYRTGAFGVQNTANGQYWSLSNPAMTPNYVQRMGMPAGGTNDWIMAGTVKSDSALVARPALGLGTNTGGGMEFVVPPGGVNVHWFHMP